MCPPGAKNNQPYAGDAQCSGDTPIAIRTDNVPKERCLKTAMLHVPPNIIPEATHLVVGSWPNVSKGCTLHTGGDWVAHWNDHVSSTNTPAHQPLCRDRRTNESLPANWDTKTCSAEQRAAERDLGERGKHAYHPLNPKSCAALAADAVPGPLINSDEPIVIRRGIMTIRVSPVVILSRVATQQRTKRNPNSLCNKKTGATPTQSAFVGGKMPICAKGLCRAYCPIIGTKGCH